MYEITHYIQTHFTLCKHMIYYTLYILYTLLGLRTKGWILHEEKSYVAFTLNRAYSQQVSNREKNFNKHQLALRERNAFVFWVRIRKQSQITLFWVQRAGSDTPFMEQTKKHLLQIWARFTIAKGFLFSKNVPATNFSHTS